MRSNSAFRFLSGIGSVDDSNRGIGLYLRNMYIMLVSSFSNLLMQSFVFESLPNCSVQDLVGLINRGLTSPSISDRCTYSISAILL